MNNRKDKFLDTRLASPEEEQRMKDTLAQMRELADSTTAQSAWIISVSRKRNQDHLSLRVSRQGSSAKNPVIKKDIDLQPVFYLNHSKDWQHFVDNRQAELDDALALVKSLTTINHMTDKE